MEILAVSIGTFLNILWVAVGLGLVIFFHELGHFAVAKWCDVLVERFSIGFGPVLMRRKWGETEYALSAIPFGGYVKMLGQDDTDPSQMSAEEIAQDPRSYSAKSVPQRMAIISAGVIMNVITGLLFFAGGFGIGVETQPAVVGDIAIGSPAWVAGMQPGDEITSINGRKTEVFADIMRGVALATSETIRLQGIRRNGEHFEIELRPDTSGTRPKIGVGLAFSLTVPDVSDEASRVTVAGTAAAKADPPFKPGDTILRVDETVVDSFPELREILARKRRQKVTFHVRRKGSDTIAKIPVEPQKFRTLGLWMALGPVAAVQDGSPARAAGIKPGDKIIRVDGMDVGTEINPLRLPDYFSDRYGDEHPVEVVVQRAEKGTGAKEIPLKVTPDDVPAWIEKPGVEEPLSVPAVGLAFHLIPTVLKVEKGSAADGKVQAEDRIQKMDLFLPESAEDDGFGDRTVTIEFEDDGEPLHNWAHAFRRMQQAPLRHVRLYVRNPQTGGGEKPREVTLKPKPASDDWYLTTRGFSVQVSTVPLQADSFPQAIHMGYTHTWNTLTDIYLTLRNLFGGRISYEELHGPVGIAGVAYQAASQGVARLLLFLGFLSVNLAVLNFLPIPVLDGGHMVFLIWEGVTRKKPSERVLVTATYAGLAFVLGLMLLVLYLDIFVHGMGQ